MKKTLTVTVLLTAIIAHANVLGLRGTLPHKEFVTGEAIAYTLKIENHGASAFLSDDYGEGLKNKVEIRMMTRSGTVLECKEGIPFGEILVLPDTAQEYTADLTRWFTLPVGNYFVQAVITRDGDAVAARMLDFAIVSGLEIGTVTRAVPGEDAATRDYTLLYWPRDDQEILFLRMTESPSGLSQLIQLGNVVRHITPTIAFPSKSTLVVTHQASQNLYIKTTIISEHSRFDILDREHLSPSKED
ncbi:MAG: hypothetical protein FWF84_00810 [Kiritimatiellaeota bacterium]|nr:hypothetical protein [Kiritimatiellota bacterium]